MIKPVICDVCDLFFLVNLQIKQNICDNICHSCATSDKLRIPILILKRIEKKNNCSNLSSYELFMLYHSEILETIRCEDKVIKQLKRKLQRKFQ